ncbi:MAG: nitrogen fixation protein NifB [Deltaproteobacteria bacterium]|nr:nitrogen fixation protein NifB [Deltaproteobacteria bacterium]
MFTVLTRDEIYRNVELAQRMLNSGINLDLDIIKELDFDDCYLEQIYSQFNMNHVSYTATKLPDSFRSPSGYRFRLCFDPHSREYSIVKEGGAYVLNHRGKALFEITFEPKPAWYNKDTSDGKKMCRVMQYVGRSKLTVSYSNECALQDKGLDCLFCNINATKKTFGELQGLDMKNPIQIAQCVKAAFDEGFRRFFVTGGFIPERREVEYYVDVAEAVRDITGKEVFEGQAVIGAPLDLEVIDKYKAVGFDAIATNMEIWDTNIFKTICPGKEQICGGRDNWVRALEREVEVFGRGRVRSTFVAGIEPKQSLLEGLEYLISRGVVAQPSQWNPNPGSALEGHRAPKAEWFLDLTLKTYALYRKYGITHQDYYDTINGEDTVCDYLFNADGDVLPWERDQYPTLAGAA